VSIAKLDTPVGTLTLLLEARVLEESRLTPAVVDH
jgi:hypothetical protein